MQSSHRTLSQKSSPDASPRSAGVASSPAGSDAVVHHGTDVSTDVVAAAVAGAKAQSLPRSSGLRMLAVHAHPDDESSKGAAMMAAYAAAGAEVMVATATGGEQGDLLNPAAREILQTHRDLPGVRRMEMAEAAEALNISHVWLGFADSGLPEGDPTPPLPFGSFATLPLEQAAAPLVRLVRRFKPHVILSYDEVGGYPHPDHIMSHKITVEAYQAAGDAARYQGLGEAWEPQKLYYDRAFNPGRFEALHQALIEAGHESPYEDRLLRFRDGSIPWMTDYEVTTQIPVGTFLEHRDRALRAHRTQVEPDGFFFATPNDFLREVWPYDDYVLVDSRVKTELPEHDLFSGLR